MYSVELRENTTFRFESLIPNTYSPVPNSIVLCLSIEGTECIAYSEQARAEHDVLFKHRSIIFRLFYISAG